MPNNYLKARNCHVKSRNTKFSPTGNTLSEEGLHAKFFLTASTNV